MLSWPRCGTPHYYYIVRLANMWLALLRSLVAFVRSNSFGLAAARVLEYDGARFAVIEPYGYYVINYGRVLYLLRDANVAIKFYVQNGSVVTALASTGRVSAGYVDALFAYPPASASQVAKFVLFRDSEPRHHSAISLLNRCLELGIFEL